MSREAVYSFVSRADSDPALSDALSHVRGLDGVAQLAAEEGLQFSPEDLRPVVALLSFLRAMRTDSELRNGLPDEATPEVFVAYAETNGYSFEPEDLSYLDVVGTPSLEELSDSDLDAVVGGTSGSRGLRVEIDTSRQRTTMNQGFAETLKAGLGKASDMPLGGAALAAPFVPGGSVLSAAIGGALGVG